MWFQFFLENIHFAINLSSALVTFAVAWLYFDAWTVRKAKKEGLRVLGFLLLSLSFVLHASYVEAAVLTTSLLGNDLQELLFTATRLPGYVLIIASLMLDPLQPKPVTKGLTEVLSSKKSAPAILAVGTSFVANLALIYPFLCGTISLLYFRRATVGLEKHLRAVTIAFTFFTLFEFLSLASLLRGTTNIDLFNLVTPFGIIWIEEHVTLLIATIILGKWAFTYLFKRIQSQLFMIITSTILVIFLITTITFTALLLRNLQNEALSQLETNVKVLGFAIESKKGETLSDAQVIAQDEAVQQAVVERNRSTLNEIAQKFLLTKGQSSLLILSDTGEVLARGEDKERVGDSLSDDTLVKRVLIGESISSVVTKDGALAPQVSIRSATPIKSGDGVIGAVLVASVIDNAFVDGVKKATGLESAIYGSNVLSATTLSSPGEESRLVGIKEEEVQVKEKVLQNGGNFTGAVTLLTTPYFAAYAPLKDVDNVPIGMLFVGKEQVGVLQAAGRSIELTFLVTVVLLILAVFPAYIVARFLSEQIR